MSMELLLGGRLAVIEGADNAWGRGLILPLWGWSGHW